MDATLGQLAARGKRIFISCMNPECLPLQKRAGHWGTTHDADAAAQQWGAETTLAELQPRLRCWLCGERRAMIEVSLDDVPMGAKAQS